MYSAQQIVELSCQICKAPGYKQQAGIFLNMILADLAQVYDFDTERETVIIPVAGGTNAYALPDNHLRTREVFYDIDGAVTMLNQMPLAEYDSLFRGASSLAYPGAFATQVEATPRKLLLYPYFVNALSLTVRYQPQPEDIAQPENSQATPWFPNQKILLKMLNAELSQLVEDERMDKFAVDAQSNLSKFLSMSDDKGGYAQQVKLDGRQFRNPGRLPYTKNTL